jgi:hypothetical protein
MLGNGGVHRGMLGIVNAKWGSARGCRCRAKGCWESSVCTERMHGIVNAKWECWETSECAEGVLGIVNAG